MTYNILNTDGDDLLSNINSALNDLESKVPYVKYGMYTLSANQITNLAVNSHIEFDTSLGNFDEPYGVLSSGSGQAKGLIRLQGGKTYKMYLTVAANFSSTASTSAIQFAIYDNTNNARISPGSLHYPVANTVNHLGNNSIVTALYTPQSDIDVIAKIITQSANVSAIPATIAQLLIEEIPAY